MAQRREIKDRCYCNNFRDAESLVRDCSDDDRNKKKAIFTKKQKSTKCTDWIYWFSFCYGVKMGDMPRMRLLLRVLGSSIKMDRRFWWGNYGNSSNGYMQSLRYQPFH